MSCILIAAVGIQNLIGLSSTLCAVLKHAAKCTLWMEWVNEAETAYINPLHKLHCEYMTTMYQCINLSHGRSALWSPDVCRHLRLNYQPQSKHWGHHSPSQGGDNLLAISCSHTWCSCSRPWTTQRVRPFNSIPSDLSQVDSVPE